MEWSLVTYRGPFDAEDRAGILRADGAVVGAAPLEGARGLVEVMDHWAASEAALRSFDPSTAEPVEGAVVLAPLRFPRKLICAGANYGKHLQEMGVSSIPPGLRPYFFLLPPTTTIIGPSDPVLIPGDPAARVDWEAELAVVIGRRTRTVTADEARSRVAGYTILNDISARGYHRREPALAPPFSYDWLGSKGLDTFCPLGPGVTPCWQVADPHDLHIRLWRNEELKQDGSTGDMLIGIWELIAAASAVMTLEPGDVLATGTPAGVGVARGEALQPGDRLAIEITGLGRLENPVAVAPTTGNASSALP
jgi:2,4-diketo-3-deoxy-L-fuconate hydrolase